jgi:hypothetical protein
VPSFACCLLDVRHAVDLLSGHAHVFASRRASCIDRSGRPLGRPERSRDGRGYEPLGSGRM